MMRGGTRKVAASSIPMKMKKSFIIFRSFRAKLTIAFILAMLFAGATSNFLIYRYAFDSQFEQLRDKLMTIAEISALTIDAATLASIQLDKEGIKSPAYSVIVQKLARIKEERDNAKVQETLARLKQAAQGSENLMPITLDAVKCYATKGEIADTLRGVFGLYQEG